MERPKQSAELETLGFDTKKDYLIEQIRANGDFERSLNRKVDLSPPDNSTLETPGGVEEYPELTSEQVQQNNNVEKDGLTDIEKESLIRGARTFDQLYAAIDKIGTMLTQQEVLTSEEIKGRIRSVRSGEKNLWINPDKYGISREVNIDVIPEKYGLRDVVVLLLEKTLIPNDPNNPTPDNPPLKAAVALELPQTEDSPHIETDRTDKSPEYPPDGNPDSPVSALTEEESEFLNEAKSKHEEWILQVEKVRAGEITLTSLPESMRWGIATLVAEDVYKRLTTTPCGKVADHEWEMFMNVRRSREDYLGFRTELRYPHLGDKCTVQLKDSILEGTLVWAAPKGDNVILKNSEGFHLVSTDNIIVVSGIRGGFKPAHMTYAEYKKYREEEDNRRKRVNTPRTLNQ